MEEYSWLQEYKRTWEQLQDDVLPVAQKHSIRSHHVRPLLRNFFLIIDCSKSAIKNDFKPSRIQLVGKIAQIFIPTFRANNPLSLLSLILVKDGLAHLVPDFDDLQPSGEFSLQNSLDVVLKQVPKVQLHYSTEVLIIQSSLWSCDPGDIWSTLHRTAEQGIVVSVIALVPEVHLMKKATEMTQGVLEIALNEDELAEMWKLRASAGDPSQGTALVPLGFPTFSQESTPCACHLLSTQGYLCPICKVKSCTLPCKCSVCGFFLITTPHLIQAALSLKPIPDFVPVGEGICCGCELPGLLRACLKCNSPYCSRCEDFIRSVLGHCINCSI